MSEMGMEPDQAEWIDHTDYIRCMRGCHGTDTDQLVWSTVL